MNRMIIFDFNRTIFDPENEALYSGAYKILDTLSKKFILILLGKDGESRNEAVAELGIDIFFNEIIFVPEKNIKQLIALKNRFPNCKDYFVIGDRIKKEITLGNEAGFKTIWLKNGKFSNETASKEIERPWKTIQDIKELKDIF